MLSNKHLNAIDNPRLVNLKLFDITYIPGKMMLGGIAALFMYGVRQCTDEDLQNMIHDEVFYARKYMISLLATAGSDEEPS